MNKRTQEMHQQVRKRYKELVRDNPAGDYVKRSYYINILVKEFMLSYSYIDKILRYDR